jgi:hypothetical protein
MMGANEAVVDRLSDEIIDRWTRFARTGDPGFPAWSKSNQPIMHFDTVSWLEG